MVLLNTIAMILGGLPPSLKERERELLMTPVWKNKTQQDGVLNSCKQTPVPPILWEDVTHNPTTIHVLETSVTIRASSAVQNLFRPQ